MPRSLLMCWFRPTCAGSILTAWLVWALCERSAGWDHRCPSGRKGRGRNPHHGDPRCRGGSGTAGQLSAMKKAIDKARQYGCGFAAVRNSNHYGIAGYYAMMALEQDMIGFSTTNADVLVVPTFGRDAMYGTNPLALAVPAGQERPFVLDMATSTVPRGKLEVYHRLEKPIPLGWATDERGIPTTRSRPRLGQFCQAGWRRAAPVGRGRGGVQRLQGLWPGIAGRDPCRRWCRGQPTSPRSIPRAQTGNPSRPTWVTFSESGGWMPFARWRSSKPTWTI
jgi:hypothetical protein